MSNKIIFTHEQRHWQTNQLYKTYNLTVEESTLEEVLSDFQLFLKGCGYQIPDNVVIDFVELDKLDAYEPQVGAGTDFESGGAGNQHSQYFFDTERNR